MTDSASSPLARRRTAARRHWASRSPPASPAAPGSRWRWSGRSAPVQVRHPAHRSCSSSSPSPWSPSGAPGGAARDGGGQRAVDPGRGRVRGRRACTQGVVGVLCDCRCSARSDSACRFSDTCSSARRPRAVDARRAVAGRAGAARPRHGRSSSRGRSWRAEEAAAQAQRETEQAEEIAAAARGAGPAGPRRARRRRPLARCDPGPGRVRAVPARRRHRGAEGDPGDIADSARTSLQDVRQVLSSTGRAPAPARRPPRQPGRRRPRRGHEVVSTEVGDAAADCRRSSRSWRSGCSRRCSPTPSGTAGATAGPRGAALGGAWQRPADRGRNVVDVRTAGRPSTRPSRAAPRRPRRSGARRDAAPAGVGRRAARRRRREDRRGRVHRHRLDARCGVTPGEPSEISVLLVDDQDLFRAGVPVIVDAQDGMAVVGAAADGREAVRLVDELEPDVVLMDIRMPEMDGVEATRQIFPPDRVARREQAGARGRADHVQPRRPRGDRDPARRERVPAQGHHPGDAARRDPHRARGQRRARPDGPVGAARRQFRAPTPPPAAYLR